jgi:hypothetical protein
MRNRRALKSWSSNQAVAILSVDNIQLSDDGRDVLQRIEDNLLTHEQAREELISRARARILKSKGKLGILSS